MPSPAECDLEQITASHGRSGFSSVTVFSHQAVGDMKGMERGKQEHKELIMGIPPCFNQSSFMITYFTYSIETKCLNTHKRLTSCSLRSLLTLTFPVFPPHGSDHSLVTQAPRAVSYRAHRWLSEMIGSLILRV